MARFSYIAVLNQTYGKKGDWKMSLSFTPKYFIESEQGSWLLRTNIKIPFGRTTTGTDLIIAESEKIKSEGGKVGTTEHPLEGGISNSFVDELVNRHLKR